MMSMNRIRCLATVAALSLAASLASAQSPTHGGTLTWSIQGTPRHLNPAVQSGIWTGQPGAQLFATPLRFDENWNPQPYLAREWEVSEDGLTVTLKLVEGATFHDGHPITSKDVAFSVMTVKEHHPFKTMMAPVESVETPDDLTAVLKLSRPHPALLLAMSSQLLSIIPEHIYGDGQDPKSHPRNSEDVVGSGPFKFVEFKRDQHIILERNENFFIEDRPYVDKIVMRIIKDASSRTIALEKGELMMSTFEQNPRELARLKKRDDLVVTDQGYAAIGPLVWLAFNHQRKPTSDPAVRKAIAYAIDRKFILNALMLGTAQEARTGFHPGSPFYEPEVEPYDLDLDKANEILDDAGYPRGDDGMRFKLFIDYGSASTKPQAEYVKPQLKKIGIDVTVRASPDFPAWAKRVSNHEFDMTWDVVFNWGDPVIGVHRTYLSSNIKKGVIWSNTQGYANPEIDTILGQAGGELDADKRKALYSKAQKILADELPVYWVHTLPYHTVTSDRLGNAPRTIWGTSSPLDEIYIKAN
ncbi:MAG: ABC transporter substrate-binding protein [Gammaproteobacteria bacterium]